MLRWTLRKSRRGAKARQLWKTREQGSGQELVLEPDRHQGRHQATDRARNSDLNQASSMRPAFRARRRHERGYAILLILLFVTVLLIRTMAVAPNILTQGRRERETDMIWRGKQYIRGSTPNYRSATT